MKFQSLFLWNIYFNYFLKKRKLSQNSVSILIFMEHLLQQPVKLYRLKINAYKIFLTELF